jgi:hypothetical protein
MFYQMRPFLLKKIIYIHRMYIPTLVCLNTGIQNSKYMPRFLSFILVLRIKWLPLFLGDYSLQGAIQSRISEANINKLHP